MTIAQLMLTEFDRSLPATRKHLERVPADKLPWRPAPKSMTLGQLALHIAMAPGSVVQKAAQDSAELPDMGEFPQPASASEILEAFDRSIDEVRRTLPGIGNDRMSGTLTFTVQGRPVMEFPRGDFLRDILLNHTYHHRGQMSVYLRELGVPVPASFGPTADEQFVPSKEPAAV